MENEDQKFITQVELAKRWNIHESTLERYRNKKKGPKFLKLEGAVRYRMTDILDYENSCVQSNNI